MTTDERPKMLRRQEPSEVAGVAAGLAAYVGVDVHLVRFGFAVLTAIGGAGLVLYAAGWLLVPVDDGVDERPIALTTNTGSLVAGFIALGYAPMIVFDTDTWGFGAELVVPALLTLFGLRLLNQRAEATAEADEAGLDLAADAPPFASRGTVSTPPASAAASTPATTAHDRASPLADVASTDGDAGGASPSEASDPTPPTPWAHPAPWATATPEPGLLDDLGPAVPAHRPEAAAAVAPPPPITPIATAGLAVVGGTYLVLANVAGMTLPVATAIGGMLTVVGIALMVSGFSGRALALYPMGGLLLALLAGSTLIDATVRGGIGTRQVRVDTVAELRPSYAVGLGELVLDLRSLTVEPGADTGPFTVEVDVGAGYAEIIVPRSSRVEIVATSSAGYVDALGAIDEGVRNEVVRTSEPVAVSPGVEPLAEGAITPDRFPLWLPPIEPPGEGSSVVEAPGVGDPGGRVGPTLRIVADVTFGYIEVRRG